MKHEDEKVYRIMYNGKYVQFVRVTGYIRYKLHDDMCNVNPMTITMANAVIGALSEDNGIVEEELTIVKA